MRVQVLGGGGAWVKVMALKLQSSVSQLDKKSRVDQQ